MNKQTQNNLLLNIPNKEQQLIAQYYLVWCEGREMNFHSEALERIIEQMRTYKAQALVTHGTFDIRQGKPERALYFYREALKSSPNIVEFIGISLAVAQLKAIEGFHQSALKDLETLIPIIKHADARLYFDLMNSYAVELGEAGRKTEARNICQVVLASPFAHAYPEWQETGEELKPARKSFITVSHKLISEPATPAVKPEKTKPASVLVFPHKLKEAPPPEKPDAVSPKEFGEMTEAEKRGLLLSLIHSGDISEHDYNRLIVAAGLVVQDATANVIDLEDEALLDKIIVIWCNMIEPEQFAAVMSALRDCKDDLRREEIIDNMIRIAFQESRSHSDSEHEWRAKVECRLPEK